MKHMRLTSVDVVPTTSLIHIPITQLVKTNIRTCVLNQHNTQVSLLLLVFLLRRL